MTTPFTLKRATDIGKTWVRICAHLSWELVQVRTRVRQSTDLERMDRLWREMQGLGAGITNAAKYADFEYWLSFNIRRIASLSLHTAAPMRILDIGCGPGYFMAAARACGHDVVGVDLPRELMSSVDTHFYAEITKALSLEQRIYPLCIQRFTPLQLPRRDLDLITAFWICFNNHDRADEWGSSEWRFFIDDAKSYLNPGGVLHLELNANPRRYGEMQWYDEPTLEVFRRSGIVNQNVVRIRN